MPVAFPSHQGLILPVWARWPRHFNGLALCVGAAAPDIVDGLAWPLRGKLGQWLGHSLFGLFVLCVPVGLVVFYLLRQLGERTRWHWLWSWLLVLDKPEDSSSVARTQLVLCSSLLLGAASHIFFDFITHDTFVLLLPWYWSDQFFPAWWSQRWTSVELFVYDEPYPIGVHFVGWLLLSVIGAIVYVRIVKRARAEAQSAAEPPHVAAE